MIVCPVECSSCELVATYKAFNAGVEKLHNYCFDVADPVEAWSNGKKCKLYKKRQDKGDKHVDNH
jgi:hypothetical protein